MDIDLDGQNDVAYHYGFDERDRLWCLRMTRTAMASWTGNTVHIRPMGPCGDPMV